ncbi:Cof-type HAD-IIB family hydrolase [Bacillus canaveralius]|uniref:Cof-type HAD-IIB family hydrolase n=1 Tax=Bacillus canaveralius TaxID=1403243 RepID=A0A2N5GH68_9BACI|nr:MULTISPECIES: Cof-type HAD-IIB family hydrolase [Bacillus]PLR80131.1 Cof-type HAD-IIB family hydrolase [Bacillus canaveralius]PLR84723.1 Cof-type HAD-IIB family hydrolase [Bacillus sp. V33-4]PLR91655.1 Cof-type HAD-IIB family hydrolase [Bacillus canaveralius]RSK57578.1 HAD family phosphatase [Bacillus canaveralius]
MIKCIAIDMDGTLLTSSHQITKENEQAIKKAQQMGVEVVIATGRSYQEARYVLDVNQIECPVIGVNGAEVRSAEGVVVAASPLAKEKAKEAAVRLLENNVYFEVYTNKGTYTSDGEKGVSVLVDIFMSANPEADVEEVIKVARERLTKGFVNIIDHYDTLFNDDQYHIYKLLAFSHHIDHLAAAKASLEHVEELAVSSSGHENLEITNEKAQKGIALEAFASSKGISLTETMAIGDNYNDLSMFKRVGRSVAMGNADDIIKAQCDFVTLTNEESGVGKAILEALNTAEARY